ARQRTGLTKGSRAALAATGAAPPDGGPEDVAETTLLAAGPAGDRGPRDESRGGRRSAGQPGAGDGRLADAWPYESGSDRNDARLADAWPDNSGGDGEQDSGGSRGAGEFRPSGQYSYRPAGQAADDLGPARRSGQHIFPGGSGPLGGPRTGRHGYRTDDDLASDPLRGDRQAGPSARARSYPDDAADEFPGAGRGPAGPGGRGQDGDLDYGSDRPAAGWRSPSGRSPSGRSPGGDWPYPELDAPGGRDREAGGRSPSGRAPGDSWPGRDGGDDLAPWRAEEDTRAGAYRLTGSGQTGSGGQRDSRPRGRHGSGRTDEPAGWPGGQGSSGDWDGGSGPSSWPGTSGDELEPLPPLDSRAGGQGRRRGPRRPDEDTGDWGRFDDEPADYRRNPAPADYEPEYEGDSW
ncbi:MAG: hypothetical protein ACR2FU_06350, partial [Streptosporangiaceae bacterium]